VVGELNLKLWVDVYCIVEWAREDELPIKQDIKLRVWSNDPKFLHLQEREAIEGETSLDELPSHIRAVIENMCGDSDSGRVIYRCHFDKANPGQRGPKYHLQFGGEPAGEEFCWLPEIIPLPRIVHTPLDLILTCELVAANFYPTEYQEIRKDLTWRSVLYQSQTNLLERYYQECLNALGETHREESGSLLEYLWNPK
jgi:hypothetical protein